MAKEEYLQKSFVIEKKMDFPLSVVEKKALSKL